MKKAWAIAIIGLVWQGSAIAEVALDERVQRMEQRMQYLESRVQDQDQVIRDKEQQISALQRRDVSASAGGWWQHVEMAGLIEVEAMTADNADINDDDVNGDVSDINVATVELGLGARINDWTRADLVLLWEEEDGSDSNLTVDTALVTIGNAAAGPFYFTAGRTAAVPFGRYETHMVSDPLTLEIGETSETIVLAGFDQGSFYGSAYLFNGDTDAVDDDNIIDNGGFNLGFLWAGDAADLDIGVSYINDLADSDGLTDHLDDGLIQDDVAAWAIHALFIRGPFSLVGEYLAASDRFHVGEVAFNGTGAQPSAWNLEAGYRFEIMGREGTVALGHQQTDEALDLGLPEKRTSLGLSMAVMQNTVLGLEWAHDEAYGTGDGGTGQEADTVTAQLAVAF